ncbi:hypothetical protein IEO21_05390 [Rhodonia placenta]|uniref:NAD(P)-binding domain-containing protein n=1 Tax=Rhodonia placenta TaxID=104341 RepID=A0A8H7P2A3_9APHY|nr:hypothetical protein IEO21_05390 [Postia placenta]
MRTPERVATARVLWGSKGEQTMARRLHMVSTAIDVNSRCSVWGICWREPCDACAAVPQHYTLTFRGGTGKTSVRIARLLQDAKIPFLLASRRGEAAAPSGMPAVKFDWLDSSTFATPFQYGFPGNEGVSAIYLVAPEAADPASPMNAFVDYAVKEHGVNRFVLMAGSSAKPGGRLLGQVWQHLIDIGVEYCVLRPTWFMAVAFRTLTDEEPHNTDYRVLGPELLTYDEIAAKLSSCLGREITDVNLTDEHRAQRLMSVGVPEYFAKRLASLEVSAANGSENRMNDVVERVTGRPPQTFDEFAQQCKSAWE